MPTPIQHIEDPELFFGIVSPVGVDVQPIINGLTNRLSSQGYTCVVIRITDTFPNLSTSPSLKFDLDQSDTERRYKRYIKYGDTLRDYFQDDSFLASIAIALIAKQRTTLTNLEDNKTPSKVAYIIRQFKRKEEIELMRSVYGRQFFQVSIYSSRDIRVDNISRKIASSRYSSDATLFRSQAEDLVSTDEHESKEEHGQRVVDIFHDADLIINADINDPSIDKQITRFIDLLSGSNSLSPTKSEYGMYTAKSAALRTLDLSRQVGAATFTEEGEVISLGTNEVPKAGGGTYWCDEVHDARDYMLKEDSNEKRKTEVISELIKLLNPDAVVSEIISRPEIRSSRFMDALEYGRIIHAEMSAICDAARLGRSLKNSILYCTTFPCHMCAKHIVAAGIKLVVFLEPYPKSLVNDLHSDSIAVEGRSRGTYIPYPNVIFKPFHGISPRRYRDMFERKKRKNATGQFQDWKNGKRSINIDIKFPVCIQLEKMIINHVLVPLLKRAGTDIEILWQGSLELAYVIRPQ